MSLSAFIKRKSSSRLEILLFVTVPLLICLLSCGVGSQSNVGQNSQGPPSPPPPPPAGTTTFYVDCSAATNGNGTQSSPWNTLTSVNTTTFEPGDQILFNRGTTCDGMLAPQGSGTASSPIVIDAYGAAPQPIIDGGMNTAAVQLTNQQGWEINNLEVIGGNYYGVNIAGTAPNTSYTHFRLSNLNVHGAHHVASANDSGEIFITIGNAGETFNDVVLDGVAVHDSQVFNGIFIDAGVFATQTTPAMLGSNVTIQNSTVYNISGIGMTLFVISNGLMQNNVVHNTGQCPLNPGCGSNTPGGLMDLYCNSCIMQNNESYAIQDWSPWDGGDFDIDVWSNNNIVQYNYGHDAAGYCVSVFSANNVVGSGNVIRYNVCSNNDQLANIADPGEIFTNTNGAAVSGTLNGIQVLQQHLLLESGHGWARFQHR